LPSWLAGFEASLLGFVAADRLSWSAGCIAMTLLTLLTLLTLVFDDDDDDVIIEMCVFPPFVL
jgi:hypothetical protein